MKENGGPWQFFIDRGGTFTDIVGLSPDGNIEVRKVLSDNPFRYKDAGIQGIREILKIRDGDPIPKGLISSIRMGTTVGTNALLERKGQRTALITTKGFKDILRIGYQNRPDLFSLKIELPELLYDHVEEIDERILAEGKVEKDLNKIEVNEVLDRLRSMNFQSIAIVLMNSYRYPSHEKMVRDLASRKGFEQISTSHEASPLIKIVGRGDTTVVDAYLSPILLSYIKGLRNELGPDNQDIDLLFMQSSGGLVDHSSFKGKDCILSGPAGGIIGAVGTSVSEGFENIITFDMGGTSTDVARYGGELERTLENQVAGVRIKAPMLRIHTIAAGGGSIIRFDDGRFQVGPDSAGADPGPASYRRGGPLTLTDANLLLGRIHPDHFPEVFGEDGNLPLDLETVSKKFLELSKQVEEETGIPINSREIAEGFVNVAVMNMSQAIKTISTMRGYDVSDHALCCFGGAGGQFACRVADTLGIERVFIHPLAGVLSAYGMGLAEIRSIREKTVEKLIDKDLLDRFTNMEDNLKEAVMKDMQSQGVDPSLIDFETILHVKYIGTDTPIPISSNDPYNAIRNFESAHRERFGFVMEDREIVLETLQVEGIGGSKSLPVYHERERKHLPQSSCQTELYIEGDLRSVQHYVRENLSPGAVLSGPCIVTEETGTTILEEGWEGRITSSKGLLLSRKYSVKREEAPGTGVDPVRLEIFNRLFISVAERMGYSLRNTACSVNIKERLDFSCAVFDRSGNLVANAPHIPVHLGSMSDSVRWWLKDGFESIQAGDVYLVNSPYHGGTHLPDLTVITPFFLEGRAEPDFFVASRGHHSDIGGKTPGSMPHDSKSIEEEGILSTGFKIVDEGIFLEEKVKGWLLSPPHPARDPNQNISDLKAQIAANEKGISELKAMVDRYSRDTVIAYMKHVQNNAEESVRSALEKVPEGKTILEMDDGSKISVRIDIDRTKRCAIVDFSGTSSQLGSNFNAPRSVCKAAVLYVFRSLVKKDIPLNEGCLIPLEIRIDEGSMLDPVPPAAVAAGNVETSMFIADAILGALGVQAGSQGTMNNLTFGNDNFQYYETICGGSGAGDGFNGTDAVHSHMTNTRITDPEVLELRYPVVLKEFSIRSGSGGYGRYQGGNGVKRRIRFLEDATVSILSQHRRIPPRGFKSGGDGKTGLNSIIRKNGTVEIMEGCATVKMKKGDSVSIDTPGGGGFGEKTGEGSND